MHVCVCVGGILGGDILLEVSSECVCWGGDCVGRKFIAAGLRCRRGWTRAINCHSLSRDSAMYQVAPLAPEAP